MLLFYLTGICLIALLHLFRLSDHLILKMTISFTFLHKELFSPLLTFTFIDIKTWLCALWYRWNPKLSSAKFALEIIRQQTIGLLCDFCNCMKLVALAIIICASLTCKMVLQTNPHTKETIFDENRTLFNVRHHCVCFPNITVLISTWHSPWVFQPEHSEGDNRVTIPWHSLSVPVKI